MVTGRSRVVTGAVVLAAGTTMICSFLPWTVDAGGHTADAWQDSAVWWPVIGLALAAALTWLFARRPAARVASLVVEVCAALAAVAYVAVESGSSVEPAGYLGIGMIGTLAILLAGDGLRGPTSTAQVLLGIGAGPLAALCALPWALDPHFGGGIATLWHSSAVWVVTVVVVLCSVTAVLIKDSRSTRLLAALPAAIAAGWALVFTVAQPYSGSGDRLEPTTVAIASFKPGPQLIVNRFDDLHVLDSALVGCGVMAALAVVLLVAAVAAVRASTPRAR